MTNSIDDFHIPSSPFVVMGVIREQSKPLANTAKIASLIASDVGLTSEILREVNSPIFAIRKPLSSVQEAIIYLGLKRISSIVLATKINEMVGVSRELTAKVWEHSRRVAEFAAKIVRYAQVASVVPDDAYTIGMLHDCGIFIRIQNDASYAKVQLQLDYDNDAGADTVLHAALGAALLKKWYLPEVVYESVRFHHDLKSVPAERQEVAYMVSVLVLAERMARLSSDPFGDSNRTFNAQCIEALSWLQLTQDEFVEIQYSLFDQLT